MRHAVLGGEHDCIVEVEGVDHTEIPQQTIQQLQSNPKYNLDPCTPYTKETKRTLTWSEFSSTNSLPGSLIAPSSSSPPVTMATGCSSSTSRESGKSRTGFLFSSTPSIYKLKIEPKIHTRGCHMTYCLRVVS